ncbi:Hypothetical predicted protein [Xyrichtys novacula]|uniref:Uncharacterized protein n=1 Tax=Xyrichtys novacula TaxID=13765 RepID=A0AAV1GPF0_XYRNO|nr:Hypothetical predicted protein [Xyrichtys novacula]
MHLFWPVLNSNHRRFNASPLHLQNQLKSILFNVKVVIDWRTSEKQATPSVSSEERRGEE